MDNSMIERRIKPVNSHRRQFQDAFPKYYPELQHNVTEKGETKLLSVKTITFIVTENCSLRCTYCYQCNKNYSAAMSKETARKAVDAILDENKTKNYFEYDTTPCAIIEFIGGEPLLEIDLMDYIADYFKMRATELDHPWAKNHMFSITTNGTHYFNPKVQNFIVKNQGKVSLTITLDGPQELHDACRVFPDGSGSYGVVVEAMKHAIANNGLKTTKITFAPENIIYIADAVKHLAELGLTDLNGNVVFEDVWVPERDAPVFYDQLIKVADWMLESKFYNYGFFSVFDETIGQPMSPEENNNWCGGNGQMLAIGTDGRMFPCLRFMKFSLIDKDLPEFEIGDVDRGIDSPEENEFLNELWSITRRSQSTDECFNCPVASGCAWCTGYNYDVFKTPNKRATFICWMHKARVLASYYYFTKLYKQQGVEKDFPLNLNQDEINFITRGKGLEGLDNE